MRRFVNLRYWLTIMIMFNSFRARITLLFSLLVLLSLGGATFFFLKMYHGDKMASLFESELANTAQIAARLEYAIAAAGALEPEQVEKSRDFLLIVDNPCAAPAGAVHQSRLFGDLTAKSGPALSAWAGVQDYCRQPGEAPAFVPGPGPGFVIPYVRIIVGASKRLAVVAMDGLGGASGGNIFFITDKSGKIVWADGGGEKIAVSLGKYGIGRENIALFADQAITNHMPMVTRPSDGVILTSAPVGAGHALFSVASEQLALAPLKFAIKQALLLAIGFLFTCLLVGKVFAVQMARPLGLLGAAAEQLGSGDLAVRVEGVDDAGAEFAALQKTFNAMAERIVRLISETRLKAELESELSIAQNVQQFFFKDKQIKTSTCGIDSTVRMAQRCGGDWWGYIDVPVPSPKTAVMIGDAVGHGISSALLTAAAQAGLSALQIEARDNPAVIDDPAALIRYFNKIIMNVSGGRLQMTFLIAIIDQRKGEVRICSAGHNKPYLVVPDEGASVAVIAANTSGDILGSSHALGLDKTWVHPWGPGTQLFLYTDGLTDCFKNDIELFDRRELLKLLRKSGSKSGISLVNAVLEARDGASKGIVQSDDITVVVCSASGGGGPA